jgi:hypothetical protein
MNDDRADAEEQELRRAEEHRLIEERNAAARATEGQEGHGEQALILPGEPDAAAVTGLDREPDDVTRKEHEGRGGTDSAAENDDVEDDGEDDDVEAAVDLGGHDD